MKTNLLRTRGVLAVHRLLAPPCLRIYRILLALPLVLATRLASATDFADVIVTGGRIYTVEPSQPWVSAVAIRDQHFAYVGTDEGALRLRGPRTQVIELRGRMAMPGLHDAHAHLLLSGSQNTVECKLPPHESATLPEVIAALQQCARGLGKDDWLVGGRISYQEFPGKIPHRKVLDAAFPDRPVILTDFSLHHVLVSSKALALAGISRATPDPPGGWILKDPDGEPTGMLLENATWLVRQHIPVSAAVDLQSVRWAVRTYNRFGFTSVQEASASRRTLTALRSLEDLHELTLNVAAHLVYGNPQFGQGSDPELEALIEHRNDFRRTHLHPDFIKLFVDGVPTPPWFTSSNMDPQSGKIQTEKLLIPPEELKALVLRFDREGLKTKLHVSGDGAAHIAIDAMAAARQANPASTLRHDLGHSTLVAQADIERMARFNIVAEVSPELWPTLDKVGNPPRRAWLFRSFQERGVLITMGTDWVVTPSPSLFVGLQGMLQRGDESISLPDAIRTMTVNGALSVGWQTRQGTIQAGKLANLIVLDRNLFDVPTNEIAATQVLLTIFEGRSVYESPPGLH